MTRYSINFTKSEADEFASLMDGLCKAFGLQVVPTVTKWIDRFNSAMNKPL